MNILEHINWPKELALQTIIVDQYTYCACMLLYVQWQLISPIEPNFLIPVVLSDSCTEISFFKQFSFDLEGRMHQGHEHILEPLLFCTVRGDHNSASIVYVHRLLKMPCHKYLIHDLADNWCPNLLKSNFLLMVFCGPQHLFLSIFTMATCM